MKHICKLFLLAAFISFSSEAFSQDKHAAERKGFVFGASIGGGIHTTDGAVYGRLSAPNFKIGAMLNPKLALLFYVPGGSYKRNGVDLAFEGFMPTAQYWISDKFYVNAGMGLAVETTPFYKVDYEQGPPEFNTGFGFTASVGKELKHWTNKTLDLQFRLLYGNIGYTDNTRKNHTTIDVLIGFNFY